MSSQVLQLAAVVGFAFLVESAIGFGATLVTVSLAALFMPIRPLLAAFVPVNVVLSSMLVLKNRAHIDRALLFRRVLPLMALGLPLGFAAVRVFDTRAMTIAFGVFVVTLSLIELGGELLRRAPLSVRPISTPVLVTMLLFGGAVHAAFGTGGPMAVYVVGRKLTDKSAFRATLSALWMCLNIFLLASFAFEGLLGAGSLTTSAALLPSLAIGLTAGDALHHRISLPTFRVLVFVLLAIVGSAVALRAA